MDGMGIYWLEWYTFDVYDTQINHFLGKNQSVQNSSKELNIELKQQQRRFCKISTYIVWIWRYGGRPPQYALVCILMIHFKCDNKAQKFNTQTNWQVFKTILLCTILSKRLSSKCN